MDESDSQCEKLDDPRISTPDGMIIDPILEYENASDSIPFNNDGEGPPPNFLNRNISEKSV
jgi:hypothetical protein